MIVGKERLDAENDGVIIVLRLAVSIRIIHIQSFFLVVQGLEVSMFKDFLITQTSSVTFGKRRLLVAKKINTG